MFDLIQSSKMFSFLLPGFSAWDWAIIMALSWLWLAEYGDIITKLWYPKNSIQKFHNIFYVY